MKKMASVLYKNLAIKSPTKMFNVDHSRNITYPNTLKANKTLILLYLVILELYQKEYISIHANSIDPF